MSGSGRWDWKAIELEFISGDMSLRELAKTHEGSFGYFAERARTGDWETKRADYRSKAMAKTVDAITDTLAVKAASIKGKALDVIEMAIINMGIHLQDRQLPDGTWVPGQVVNASDMAKLLDRLMPLIGQPNNINENRGLNIDLSDKLPTDVARVLAEIAEERGSNARPVGRAPLPGARAARPD